ncbi:hypothetical protein J6590_064140 [Homalodisca vitripennis]|nr:hypothetical protein J6590_064140 [Homalodisca vitripennis]
MSISSSFHSFNTLFHRPKLTSSSFVVPVANLSFWKICHNTFINHYNWVTVVSVENEILDPRETYNQFGLIQWHSPQNIFPVPRAAIIIVTASEELNGLLYTNSALWNQRSIFVIVVLQCFEDVTSTMSTMWKLYHIYKYVLICGKFNPVLYIYRPYVPAGESRIFRITDIAQIRTNIRHAVDNMHGSKMRIVFFSRTPTVITYKGEYVGGVDYAVFLTLRERMNFTSVTSRPSDGRTFAQAGRNVSGAIRDIVLGKADISLNGHFIQDYKTNKIMLTRQAYMDRMCFIVAMPSLRSHFTNIVHIFCPSVWGVILTIHLTIIIIYYGTERVLRTMRQPYEILDLFFIYYALIILGISKLRSESCSKRFLLGSVLIMVLILNNTFQGSLVPIFNKPIRNHYIDTLEDVINSDLALQSTRAETILTDPEIVQLLSVLRHRELKGNNFVRLGRFAIMRLEAYSNYLLVKGNSTEYLHRVEECIMTYFLAYVVPRNSPFIDRINTYLLKFQETGLSTKWFGSNLDYLLRNTYRPLEKNQLAHTKVKVISMADLSFDFAILLVEDD